MTVAELIKKLKDLPQDAEVLYTGGEYLGDYRNIRNINYQKESDYARKGNTVLIK